ncbi:Starch synthase, chloroplastic/amyloplastic [Cocos nucifera]|uniref:starch synthase n=1 Tax=Cocos nucifera TaxID=13894 RepID=A0A8K0IAP0_COCNU|nr:Starch synthase, chloroplastic/amyloplastic [Cocos nucifera]
MASEACGALVLGHGLSYCKPFARHPITRPRPFLSVSCKMRHRNSSSQHRRQVKKVTPEPHLNLNLQPQSEESHEVQNSSTKNDVRSHQETLSTSDADACLVTKTDGLLPSSIEEKNIAIEHVDGGQQPPIVHLQDLIGMIRNAEKNILLLNQARVRALEDLDKILSEKETLQAEMNVLEMKLAETDARLKVAAQEKINVELLEDQLEKLNNEMSSRNTIDGQFEIGGKIWNPDLSSLDAGNSPLVEDLDALKKENMLLKDDVQTLKAKLTDVKETEERVLVLEKERSSLEDSLRELESRFSAAQIDVSKLTSLTYECKALRERVENLQTLLENATQQADQAKLVLQQNQELRQKVEKLEASLEETNAHKFSSDMFQHYNELLQQKVELLDERLEMSDQEINSQIQLYQESVKEFQDTLEKLKEESERRSLQRPADDMPWQFWSRLLLTIDGLLLEKKLLSNDAKLLREMAWKRDVRIRDAYLACKGKNDHEIVATFLKLTLSQTSPGLHVVHIAAEMAPVAKVGGLGDVVSGLGKALQRRGHLVEIVLPKYDCMQHDHIGDLKVLDVVVQSYFDGQLFKNKIWVGTVEGLPVYFIEPHHPANFFWRGRYYGEHDDFKRFSFFSRAALELLYQTGKRPDIIHCHDWQTAFVAPLYWEIYARQGFNSARICFTCHNFEYQGTTPASELGSCGLDVHHLNRPDRMQDNSTHDKVNPVKGAIIFSNIVTTVSPTYAQEVRTAEGGRGLHETLKFHSKKFVGILNGIDTDAWNPSTDGFLSMQYNADDLHGKAKNKDAIRKYLKLSSTDAFQPLREFEGIANHFQSHPHVRLLLKYDDALSHTIYAASDMFVIPSMFEPCGLTQMIAMRYGAVPIVRKTGGLTDSVFDVDDDTIPVQYRNGFTFMTPDEQGLSSALERAFSYYMKNPVGWQQLVRNVMRMDFCWDSSAAQYEELYEKSVARARAAAARA